MIWRERVMLVATNEAGYTICARCGKIGERLTKDHFVPKSCRMNVNEEGNYVGLCESCNKEKGCRVVKPDWYVFLSEVKRKKLLRYMRYARSYILANVEDEEVVDFVRKL